MFLDGFIHLLEDVMLTKGKFIIVGDFNIEMDNLNNPSTAKLCNLLQSLASTNLFTMLHILVGTH